MISNFEKTLFALAALAVLIAQGGCQETDEEEIDPGFDCEGEHLFNHGISSITDYTADYYDGSWVLFDRFTYQYDDMKRRTTSTAEYWSEDGTSTTLERHYEYDAAGRPVLLSWEEDDRIGLRSWIYDSQGRVVSHKWEYEADGGVSLQSIDTYSYGPDGRPSKHNYEYNPEGGSGTAWSCDFEYDDSGRLSRKILSTREDGSFQSVEYYEYEYDNSDRLAKTNYFRAADGSEPERETICEYSDGSALLAICTDEQDMGYSTYRNVATYEFEENKLTITLTDETYAEPRPKTKRVIEYDYQADSAFHEATEPIPAQTWIRDYYGNGVFNGCI